MGHITIIALIFSCSLFAYLIGNHNAINEADKINLQLKGQLQMKHESMQELERRCVCN